MAEELELRIHTDLHLCKATVEKHLKINEKKIEEQNESPDYQ